MDDTGEIAFVQGVQGVFHPPQRFTDWPDADHGNRLVCIARDLESRTSRHLARAQHAGRHPGELFIEGTTRGSHRQ